MSWVVMSSIRQVVTVVVYSYQLGSYESDKLSRHMSCIRQVVIVVVHSYQLSSHKLDKSSSYPMQWLRVVGSLKL